MKKTMTRLTGILSAAAMALSMTVGTLPATAENIRTKTAAETAATTKKSHIRSITFQQDGETEREEYDTRDDISFYQNYYRESFYNDLEPLLKGDPDNLPDWTELFKENKAAKLTGETWSFLDQETTTDAEGNTVQQNNYDVIVHYKDIQLALTPQNLLGLYICDEDQNLDAGGSVSYNVYNAEGQNISGSYVEWSSSVQIPQGYELSLFASPAPGYRFKGWYNVGGSTGEGGLYKLGYDPESLVSTETEYRFKPSAYGSIAAVFYGSPMDPREVVQFQVWNSGGGKTSIEYENDDPDPYFLEDKDGTEFVSGGDIGWVYKGIPVTVTAQPDEGYRFKGWYHVDIQWGGRDAPADSEHALPYMGEPISEEERFTYNMAETIVDGDTEPLRYICAVFEEDDEPDGPAYSYIHVLRNEGGSFTIDYEGKTSDDQPYGVEEGKTVTLTAVPDEGYVFKGWYKGDVNASSYDEMFTDELLSGDTVYSFAAVGYPYVCAVFEKEEKPALLRGDIDLNGSVDYIDVDLMISMINKEVVFTDLQMKQAELDGTDGITYLDLSCLISMINKEEV